MDTPMFQLVSTVVAVIAAGIAWRQNFLARKHAKAAQGFANEANRIQERLAKIEEARHAEELAQGRNSTLIATTEFWKEQVFHLLDVSNEGPGWARQVRLVGEGAEGAAKWQGEDGQDLEPNNSRGYKIPGGESSLTMILNWNFEWTTDNGESRKVRIRKK